MTDAPMLYYLSHDTIDRMYRQRLGPPENETVSERQRQEGTVSAQVSLGKLISFLGEIGGNGNASAMTEEVATSSIEETEIDRAIELIESLAGDDQILSIDEFGRENREIYSFSHPMKIEYTTVNNNETLVSVSSISSDIRFEGLTSPENWASKSLLNGLLTASLDHEITLFGLLHPVQRELKDDSILNVQYLMIASNPLIENE